MTDMTNYPWMFDAILIIAMLACACVKGVKGIYKSLMPLAVILVSVLGATFLSAVLTGPVTDLVYPVVEDKLIAGLDMSSLPTEQLDRWTWQLQNPTMLAKKCEELIPAGYRTAANRLGIELGDFLTDAVSKAEKSVDVHDYLTDEQIEKLTAAGIEVKTAVQTALDSTASAVRSEGVIFSAVFSLMRRITSVAVHYILWCIACIGLLAALTIIKNTFDFAFKLPVIGWVDKAGGALLGIAECGIAVFVLGWITKLIGFPILQQLSAGTRFLRLLV